MREVLHIMVIATIGAIVAALLAEFARNDPNKKTGIFGRAQAVWSWAITNAYGNN